MQFFKIYQSLKFSLNYIQIIAFDIIQVMHWIWNKRYCFQAEIIASRLFLFYITELNKDDGKIVSRECKLIFTVA